MDQEAVAEFVKAQQEALALAEQKQIEAVDWLLRVAEEGDDHGCFRMVPKKKGLFGLFRRN